MSDCESAWQKWLNSRQCIPVLQRCVLSMGKVFSEGAGYDYTSSETDLNELTSDFWLYLRTRSNQLDKELSKFILHKQWDKLKRKLTSMFRFYLKERYRDPYYRHVRQVLYDCPDLTTVSSAAYTFYAIGNKSALPLLGERIQYLPEYSSWSAPDVHLEKVNKKEGILQTAFFFWNRMKECTGSEYLVPVRELIRYIYSQYDKSNIHGNTLVESEMASFAEDEDNQGERSSGDLDCLNRKHCFTGYKNGDIRFSRQWLKELACVLVNRFDEIQFELFCLFYFQELSMREIAARFGYKRESSIHYHLNKIHYKIKDFCSMWPSLSPPDYDENVFADFFEAVVNYCPEPE